MLIRLFPRAHKLPDCEEDSKNHVCKIKLAGVLPFCAVGFVYIHITNDFPCMLPPSLAHVNCRPKLPPISALQQLQNDPQHIVAVNGAFWRRCALFGTTANLTMNWDTADRSY